MADRWRVRTKRERKWWNVWWSHRTETSSWWSDETVEADTAEEAAAKVFKHLDVNEHTSYRDRRITMRVYGPIPVEFTEFKLGESVQIEAVAEGEQGGMSADLNIGEFREGPDACDCGFATKSECGCNRRCICVDGFAEDPDCPVHGGAIGCPCGEPGCPGGEF